MFFMAFAFFASLGLPGLNGFVSEFMILIGAFNAWQWWVLVPLLTVVLTAVYYLVNLHRMMLGDYNEALDEIKPGGPKDSNQWENIALGILCFLMLVFGIFPFLFLDLTANYSMMLASSLGGAV